MSQVLRHNAYVRVVDTLLPSEGIRLTTQFAIDNRKPGSYGTVERAIEGHDNNVWIVKHDNETRAAYWRNELVVQSG